MKTIIMTTFLFLWIYGACMSPLSLYLVFTTVKDRKYTDFILEHCVLFICLMFLPIINIMTEIIMLIKIIKTKKGESNAKLV